MCIFKVRSLLRWNPLEPAISGGLDVERRIITACVNANFRKAQADAMQRFALVFQQILNVLVILLLLSPPLLSLQQVFDHSSLSDSGLLPPSGCGRLALVLLKKFILFFVQVDSSPVLSTQLVW
ncbi:unnamed protein product [Clonostachys rosea f. rosea IK726]|uniref:Uncharacterized protein n=1 Tax=Clonostachys rosea f. rosea IK726 TaxID=1349383 RepID=A0ACA9TQY3_BIOOC|nr:unnamed protein product [Clonostachys rosea f. rosea IK726]